MPSASLMDKLEAVAFDSPSQVSKCCGTPWLIKVIAMTFPPFCLDRGIANGVLMNLRCDMCTRVLYWLLYLIMLIIPLTNKCSLRTGFRDRNTSVFQRRVTPRGKHPAFL